MARSEAGTRKQKEKRIDILKGEYQKNEQEKKRQNTILKEERIDLGQKGTISYKFEKRRLELEIREFKIKIDEGFKPFNPKFWYEKGDAYQNLLKDIAHLKIDIRSLDLKDIESLWEVQSSDMREQLKMIDERQPQIKDELKELGVDMRDFDEKRDKDYIG